jgi:hypothetical protein
MRRRPNVMLVGFALVILVLVACSPQGGSLQVTPPVLPATAAHFLFAGPSGSVVIVTSASIPLLAGTYTVTVQPVLGAELVAATAYDGEASPATITVSAGSTANVAVEYTRRPGTGKVVVGGGTDIAAFDASVWLPTGNDLEVSLDEPPNFVLPGGPHRVLVDPRGALYSLARSGETVVRRYPLGVLDGLELDGSFVPEPEAVSQFIEYPVDLALVGDRLFVLSLNDPVKLHWVDVDAMEDDPGVAALPAVLPQDGLRLSSDELGRLWIVMPTGVMRIDSPLSLQPDVSIDPDMHAPLDALVPVTNMVYRDGSLYVSFDCTSEEQVFLRRYDDVDDWTDVMAPGDLAPAATFRHDYPLQVCRTKNIAFDRSGAAWVQMDSTNEVWSGVLMWRFDDLATQIGVEPIPVEGEVVYHDIGNSRIAFSIVSLP